MFSYMRTFLRLLFLHTASYKYYNPALINILTLTEILLHYYNKKKKYFIYTVILYTILSDTLIK